MMLITLPIFGFCAREGQILLYFPFKEIASSGLVEESF